MAWVTDLTHFLGESGGLHRGIAGPARRRGEYLGAIVAAATSDSGLAPQIPCRRRPRPRRCPGVIAHRILTDTRIHCACPHCGDNGFISNWQGTARDNSPPRLH
jgi:hypothetical protein